MTRTERIVLLIGLLIIVALAVTGCLLLIGLGDAEQRAMGFDILGGLGGGAFLVAFFLYILKMCGAL